MRSLGLLNYRHMWSIDQLLDLAVGSEEHQDRAKVTAVGFQCSATSSVIAGMCSFRPWLARISVRHVSNLLDSGRTIADQRAALKVGSKGRLQFDGRAGKSNPSGAENEAHMVPAGLLMMTGRLNSWASRRRELMNLDDLGDKLAALNPGD